MTKSLTSIGTLFDYNMNAWKATVTLDGEEIFLGYFGSESKAANAIRGGVAGFNWEKAGNK